MSRSHRKPAAQRELEGNRGHRPVPVDEPSPTGVPRCPAWMDPRARRLFRRLAVELKSMGILAACDFGTIAEAAAALADISRYQAMIQERERGAMQVNSKGDLVQHRFWFAHEEHKAWERYHRAAIALGLSPSARAGLHAQAAKETELTEAERKLACYGIKPLSVVNA